jgi:hypothetical protein
MLRGMSDIKLNVNNSNIAVVAPLDAHGIIIVVHHLGTHLITIHDMGLVTPVSTMVMVDLVPIL